jgi:hypothetical protein
MGFMKRVEKALGEKAVGGGRSMGSVTEKETLSPVGSVAEAQERLSFAVREPQSLGIPSMIAASSPSDAVAGKGAVLFRYEDPTLGPLTVLERAGDEVVTIRGGIQAIVMSSATGSMARWVENGVAFTVIAERAARDQLLGAVEKI